MSNVISTGSLPKLLWPGINTVFGYTYDEYKMEYKEIYATYQSSQRYEEDLQVVSMGLATPKGEGDAIQYDSFSQGYSKRYVHVVYAKGFALTMEAEDDIKYGVKCSAVGAQQLASSMRQTKEIIGANILNFATSTSQTYVGADGVALLSASHPLGAAGGTSSNTVSADLSEVSLEDAVIAIMGLVDDAGKRIALMPTKIIIPKEQQFIAHRILKSDKRVATTDNDANALKDMGFLQSIVVNHYLTDTNSWFIKTDLPEMQGFRHFERKGYTIETDREFNTKNTLCTATERYCFGVTNWRCVYGSLGI
jgi:hypothetical protein